MTKYGLNIVFRMKTYPQFLFEGESNEFAYDSLNFKLTKLSDLVGSYSLMIKPVEDMDHAKYLLNHIKLALTLFVLQYNWVAIEIDEDIKLANIFDEETLLINDKICSGEFDINRTTLFPVIPNLFAVQSHPLSFKNKLNINNLKENINDAFSLDYEKIYDDEKLSLALEIYSKHSQFSRKGQFLDLVTILEILKPEYSVSVESLESISIIKKEMKNIRDRFEKDSEEYKEFNRYFTDMGFWKTKSINNSLQQFAKEHQNEFEEYWNIGAKVKKTYDIRSNIVHNGIIDEEFNEYYDFLKDFVGRLLKIMINENNNNVI